MKHTYTIRISDGYCCYEYSLPSDGDWAVRDIYEIVRIALKAPPVEGVNIPINKHDPLVADILELNRRDEE